MDVNGAAAPTVQADGAAADQLPQPIPSSTQPNANRRPTRRSHRLQRKAEREGWLSAQGPGYAGFTSAPSQTDSSFYNSTYNNNNMNPAQSQYSAGNSFMSQNPNSNMVNFGLASNYAVSNPSPFNQPPVLQQPQLLQMQFAQQMMMAQQIFGAAGNGSFFNNAGGMHQQPIRTMSTMVNAVMETSVTPTQDLNPSEATPDTAMQVEGNNDNEKNEKKKKKKKDKEKVKNKSSEQPRSKKKSNPVQPPETPVPRPSYLVQARREPKDLAFHQPLLIILDLNGTLLYRKNKKFPPQFVRRPALDYFLQRLTTRHAVMVWSSSQPETVNAICNRLFTEVQKEKLVTRWGRDKLGLDERQYYSKVQVYKELDKVWADEDIQSTYPQNRKLQTGRGIYNVLRRAPYTTYDMEMSGATSRCWDQSNTVLIDDSTIKAAANPYNILEVPEFTNEPNDDDTTVLKTVLAKITMLSKSNDVSARLRSWGEKGIKISRDEVLKESSASEEESSASGPETDSESKAGKEDNNKEMNMNNKEKGNDDNYVPPDDGLVYDTDNKIVPHNLSYEGTQALPKLRNRYRPRRRKLKRRKANKSLRRPKNPATDTDGDLIQTGFDASGAAVAAEVS
ncbi:hypothetical protein UA08_07948 [Talaromyces atroroseus]|uniref:FCP1 homology domain-containing protein n=1 Tax=Talaromyces atroroseus TaxID=1441469 RepID=A0A225A8M4_TALAT|nr:hypothetical protein UA08_07948 [Talaromyces atroroseus]OKL57002.1 hypothetical protein UA08_07948 [Talaromyces atroroseus]